jgi:CubicO group peptidase (beta-lactamase class C family)
MITGLVSGDARVGVRGRRRAAVLRTVRVDRCRAGAPPSASRRTPSRPTPHRLRRPHTPPVAGRAPGRGAGAPARGPAADPGAVVDTALPRIMRDAKVVGLNIAVVNGDTTVYDRVFGLRDREARVPADTGTVFEAASLTKPVFAYLVMGLARDGVLTSTLRSPATSRTRHRARPAQQAGHRAHGALALERACRAAGRVAGRLRVRPRALLQLLGRGHLLPQLVVERLLGRPLDVAMRERVFAPLGMAHSSMVWTPAIARNYATGYDYHDQRADKWKPDKPARPPRCTRPRATTHGSCARC